MVSYEMMLSYTEGTIPFTVHTGASAKQLYDFISFKKITVF